MKELNIAFSWNADLLLDGGEDKLCRDGDGDNFVGNGIPMFSLMEPKTILAKMRMVDNYRKKVKASAKLSPFKSIMDLNKILL